MVDASGGLPTSNWTPGAPGRTAGFLGTLNGGRTSTGQHVWLDLPSGERAPVVWPHGWSARFDPLELLDADGTVIARTGDCLQFGGGLAPIEEPVPPSALGEHHAIFVMSEVSVRSAGDGPFDAMPPQYRPDANPPSR